ncbi:MAG: hypothetical protein ACR2QM_10185 [Longimicrobiales bacterium]
MDRLKAMVDLALEEIVTLRSRLERAEERSGQSDELLREFVGGKQDPGSLARKVSELEAQNAELRDRLAKGHAGVTQVLAKVRFLEDRQ